MPVIEYARTRIFRQARQARTPPPVRATGSRAGVADTRPVPMPAAAPSTPAPETRAEARAGRQPEARSGPLAHPRLVPRPPTSPPPLPRLTLRPTTRDHDFEDEPTDQMAGRSHDVTRPRDVTAARSRR